MTNHIELLDKIQADDFRGDGMEIAAKHRIIEAAVAELRRLQKLIDDCAPYLNEGETPAEALEIKIATLKAERDQLVALAKFGRWCLKNHKEFVYDIYVGDVEAEAITCGLITRLENDDPKPK
jgi:hypothetical protein